MKQDDKINNLREELMEKIDDIKNDVQDIKLDIAKLPEILVEKFDQRYASKETEISVKRVMWIVVSAVIVALLALVIKQ